MSKKVKNDDNRMAKLKEDGTFGRFGQPISYKMLPLAAIIPKQSVPQNQKALSSPKGHYLKN